MIFRSFLCALTVAAAGCGSTSVVPVSGRVTLNGQPAAGVHVGFQPMSVAGKQNPGGGSYAITDPDGGFSLRLVETDQPGAVVGEHRVEIIARNETDDDRDRRGKAPPLKLVIPAEYNRESQLTFPVPSGGSNAANFELKSR